MDGFCLLGWSHADGGSGERKGRGRAWGLVEGGEGRGVPQRERGSVGKGGDGKGDESARGESEEWRGQEGRGHATAAEANRSRHVPDEPAVMMQLAGSLSCRRGIRSSRSMNIFAH